MAVKLELESKVKTMLVKYCFGVWKYRLVTVVSTLMSKPFEGTVCYK